MKSHIPFTLASPTWYDVPWAPHSPCLTGDISVMPADAPGWTSTVDGPWQIHLPPQPPGMTYGWKVHVAATPQDLESVGSIVARWCVHKDTAFKVLRTRRLVHASQLKYADRVQSGKVCTCYPAPELLEEFCVGLADLLRDVDSPSIHGELRVGSSPVWLRHGSFQEAWALSPTGAPTPVLPGTTIPDRRGTTNDRAHDTPWIQQLRRTNPTSTVLPIHDVTLLHRSNAGGVYRALWQDDRPVVIKEARHLCGLDADGIDAPARLRHEFQVLQRLAPHRVAPQPIDLLETPEGTFLVMGFLEGMTLYQEMARFHPLSGHGSSRMSHAEFSRWRQDTMESLKDLIQILSECGIVHGDLHPANLIHVGNDLFATDFESSSIDGVSVSTGLTALPFRSDKDACDLEAVAHIHALLLDPTSGPVLTRRPELRSFVTRAALEDITMTAPPAPDMMPHLEHLCTELADGIRASATPSRTDRLFPSDPYLFQHPGAELGLMHGAAGVLAALSATGHEIDPDHVSWLTNRLSSQPILLPGLADGVEGIALGLSMCGEGDLSAQLLDRTGVLDSSSQTPIDPSLGTGLAGRAAVLQTLSRRLSSDRLAQAASTLWERLATVIRDADGPLPNGLFTGWEGVGLAVLSSPLPDRHHLANIALELALSTTVTIDGALISEAGGVQWPYLGQGPIACGPLAEALGDAGTVASVARTCRSPLTESSGLLLGRSGLLVVLRQLIGDDNAAVQRHMMRLAWSITGDGTTSHMLGLHGLRFSSDVATGSAGALLTLSDHPWKNIAKILGILGDRCHEDLMTIGSVATPWAPED